MRYKAEILSPGVAWATGIVPFHPEPPPLESHRDWQNAHAKAQKKLNTLYNLASKDNERAIIDAQIAMLNDPEWIKRVESLVTTMVPPKAIMDSADEFAVALEQLADPYLKQRAQDIRDVAHLWCQSFAEEVEPLIHPGMAVVTSAMSVHDILQWANIPVAAVICEQGSSLMHASLIAQNLGIPVLKLPAALSILPAWDGHTPVKIDAEYGYIAFGEELLSDPSPSPQEPTSDVVFHPLHKDGVTLEIMANISSAPEAARTQKFGADGVGLVRTEFLLESRGHLLSQDEQVDLYRQILHHVPGPVIFRTFDLGSDKALSFLPALAQEPNPALGHRGVRVYFQHPDILRTQLTALALSATPTKNISIMFPMISNLDEWRYCWNMGQDVLHDLHLPPLWFQWGLMIEVPSAAFLIPEFAQAQAQFGSIGTNDLCQYFVAKDREIAENSWANAPDSSKGMTAANSQKLGADGYAFAKFLSYIAAEAQREKMALSVCGQLASDPKWALFFIALRIYRLSMTTSSIPKIKAYLNSRLQSSGLTDIKQQTQRALSSVDEFAQWMNDEEMP